jgi:hypothetical protein
MPKCLTIQASATPTSRPVLLISRRYNPNAALRVRTLGRGACARTLNAMKKTITRTTPLLVALALIACSGKEDQPSHMGKLITRDSAGEAWAFTVDSGYVYSDSGAAIFESGGTKYALNGTAKGMGYTPVDPIWRTHPESTGGQRKIDIGPYIQAALANPK